MKTRFSILFLIIIFSCGRKVKVENIESVTIDSNRYYFPLEIFADTSSYIGRDTFFVERYTQNLKALGESSFFNKAGSKDMYRLLWLRTFHNPVAIRIEKHQDDYRLFWKVSNGKGGYAPGELIGYKSRQISQSDWDQFQKLIAKIDFWNAESTEKGLSGDDGSRWIIEGVRGNDYHVTDRWTPRNDDYFTCGEFLIKLTDLDIPKEEMY
jgi:hypothetical protein